MGFHSKIALPLLCLVLIAGKGLVAGGAVARRCRIVITLMFENGKAEENSFYTNAQTKEQCIGDASDHKINFAPQLVREKRVRSEWNRP